MLELGQLGNQFVRELRPFPVAVDDRRDLLSMNARTRAAARAARR